MKCLYTSRCDNPKLTYFENMYTCNNCFSCFKKHHKKLNKHIIVKCCDKQNIIYSYNKPLCFTIIII